MTKDAKPATNLLEQVRLFFLLLFYTLFAWLQWWSAVSPRMIRGSAERDAIHHAHLSLGTTLFIISILLLLFWLLRRNGSPLSKLKQAFSSAAASGISLFFIATFFTMLYGLAQAWAKDEHTKIVGVFELSPFLNWSWSTAGYMHAAVSNLSVALFAGILFVYLYLQLKKYVQPGIAVALLMLLHLLAEMPKPPSLHPIAAFGSYVLVPSYYLIALALYTWANSKRWVYWPVYSAITLLFLYLPFIAFKALPPWHKSSAELVKIESTEPLSTVRSPSEIFNDDEELASAKETAAWCTQCHNVNPTGDHLLGPNLARVFNSQAGTVESYGRSSKAMIEAGQNSVFWTRENLAQFLTDGQGFIPNNLMNQQTDLSNPERLNQVIDWLEYLSVTTSEAAQ